MRLLQVKDAYGNHLTRQIGAPATRASELPRRIHRASPRPPRHGGGGVQRTSFASVAALFDARPLSARARCARRRAAGVRCNRMPRWRLPDAALALKAFPPHGDVHIKRCKTAGRQPKITSGRRHEPGGCSAEGFKRVDAEVLVKPAVCNCAAF